MTATLGCLNCPSSSRKVFTIDLLPGTVGVVYKLDLRDTGQPLVSWSTALALAGTLGTGGATAPALLMAASSTLASRGSAAPTKPTSCHWYVTGNPLAARQFTDTKGTITDQRLLYKAESNVPQVTRPLSLPAGLRQLYICVNNDNQLTSATATLSVTALVQTCE